MCCHFSKVPLKSSKPTSIHLQAVISAAVPRLPHLQSSEPLTACVYSSMPGRRHLSDITIGRCSKGKIRQDFFFFLSCDSVARSKNHLFNSVMLIESPEILPEKSIPTQLPSLCLPSRVSLILSQHPLNPTLLLET